MSAQVEKFKAEHEEVIKNIASIIDEKQKEYGHPIYLMSDEPYRELLFDDQKYPFVTNYFDNSIVTYSFSKSASIPGDLVPIPTYI